MSENDNDIEESRSIGYRYSKYNIVEDYDFDFYKISELNFKNDRKDRNKS